MNTRSLAQCGDRREEVACIGSAQQAGDGRRSIGDGDTDLAQAVSEGRMEQVAALLGRPFVIRGEVVHGRKLGRTIGYPTANIELGGGLAPRFGVYATRTLLPDGRKLPGVANVGINPTVGEIRPRLEVWLFDFDEDLYGAFLETELLTFLRPEARFGSLDELVVQIGQDAQQARALLEPQARRSP